MNETVKNYLETKKKKCEEKKAKKLVELGICEKIYSPDGEYSSEYYLYDEKEKKHYKKIPIEVTDEEYDEILKYSENADKKEYNIVARILKGIAWFFFVGGFIVGFTLGVALGEQLNYNPYIAMFTIWGIYFVFGMMFIGFAEIIQLLQDIKNK